MRKEGTRLLRAPEWRDNLVEEIKETLRSDPTRNRRETCSRRIWDALEGLVNRRRVLSEARGFQYCEEYNLWESR